MKVVYLGNCTKENLEERIREVSAAGRISRTEGKAYQVYELYDDYEKNLKFIKRVVKMGHGSIAEHDYLFFSIDDITPIVEHTLIGSRLASFTVKSRREVDFRMNGFYIPEFRSIEGKVHPENERLKKIYCSHMNKLINEYSKLVDSGVKLENARYMLPYCFNSNMFMGLDARSLVKLTRYLLYSNVSDIAELKELGNKFLEIIDEYVPYMSDEVRKERNASLKFSFIEEKELISPINIKIYDKVNLIGYTENADLVVSASAIMEKYQVSFESAKDIILKTKEKYPTFVDEIIKDILISEEQRELEQVNFRFEIPIPLAVRTHLERHRMQSLITPDFVPLWNLKNYDIIPGLDEKQKENYHNVFKENEMLRDYFIEKGVNCNDLVYFYQAAHMCNVTTNINGRSLVWISRMRCCNKAQYAIRKIVNEMCNEVKKVAPIIGNGLGATCDVFKVCNEGKESCGKILTKK